MATKKSIYYQMLDADLEEKLKQMESEMPAFMQDYFLSQALSKGKRTRIAYIQELKQFLEYLIVHNPLCKDLEPKEIPVEIMQNLSFRDINEYLAYKKNSGGNGAASLQRTLSSLRGYFKYEVTHGNLMNDPTAGAEKPERVHKKPINRLSKNEVCELLDGVECSLSGTEHSRNYTTKTQLRDTAVFTLMLNTGLRVSECAGLDIEDINFVRGCVRVMRKGGDLEDVYFNKQTEKALRDYINLERTNYAKSEGTGPLFISNRGGRMSVRTIQVMVKKYGVSVLSRSDLHAHSLRKTFGSNLYEQSGDIRLVASILNHKSINTTIQHYADITDKHKASNRDINLYNNNEQ